MVNSLADICKGDFTRVQKACVDGVDTTFRTSIDYVLVPSEQEDRTISLTIVDESGLDSDLRPLLLDTLWRPGPRCGPGTQRVTPRWERWCVADASENGGLHL